MSGAVEDWDGLCGAIDLLSTSACRVRCKYVFDHSDKHSWQDKPIFMTRGGHPYAWGASYWDEKKK